MEQVYVRRLMKLARHMLSFTAEQNATHFRMRTFIEHHDDEARSPAEALLKKWLTDCYCGTVACAVGHAPTIFPTLVAKFDKECGEFIEEFQGYDENAEAVYKKVWLAPSYTALAQYLFNVSPHSDTFEWLFGGSWDSGKKHAYHSTSWAVADRILHYIKDPDCVYKWRASEWDHAARASIRAGLITRQELDEKIEALKKIEDVLDVEAYEL